METQDMETLGFGFVTDEGEHHFLVTVPPKSDDDPVYMSEHFEWDEIAEATKAEFNRRLREEGEPTGQWQTGQVPVSRLFGKELVLLAWAIEDADPAKIPTAIRNWRGLASGERWWLFTMTNAATGHAVTDRNKGWPKAVRYALSENPVSGSDVESRKEMDFGLFRER